MIFFRKIYDQVVTAIQGEVFYAEVKEEWGSHNTHHRVEIRKALLEYLKRDHPHEVENSIWDLDTPPILKTLKVSISHCHGLGGFVVCSRPVGLDIELKSRITPKILERITSKEERKICPQQELLWTAKEAVFKCNPQYVMITQINIDGWNVAQNDTYQFFSLGVQGWALSELDHSYALAIKNS